MEHTLLKDNCILHGKKYETKIFKEKDKSLLLTQYSHIFYCTKDTSKRRMNFTSFLNIIRYFEIFSIKHKKVIEKFYSRLPT